MSLIPGARLVLAADEQFVNIEKGNTDAIKRQNHTFEFAHFVRNNGIVPERALNQDSTDWNLSIEGEVGNPLQLSLDDLKHQFPVRKAAQGNVLRLGSRR